MKRKHKDHNKRQQAQPEALHNLKDISEQQYNEDQLFHSNFPYQICKDVIEQEKLTNWQDSIEKKRTLEGQKRKSTDSKIRSFAYHYDAVRSKRQNFHFKKYTDILMKEESLERQACEKQSKQEKEKPKTRCAIHLLNTNFKQVPKYQRCQTVNSRQKLFLHLTQSTRLSQSKRKGPIIKIKRDLGSATQLYPLHLKTVSNQETISNRQSKERKNDKQYRQIILNLPFELKRQRSREIKIKPGRFLSFNSYHNSKPSFSERKNDKSSKGFKNEELQNSREFTKIKTLLNHQKI